MHQAIAFAIASEFCRKRQLARNFCSKNETFAISFAKPFAIASESVRSAQVATFSLRVRFIGGENSPANFRGCVSEFAFAFNAATEVHSGGIGVRVWQGAFKHVARAHESL